VPATTDDQMETRLNNTSCQKDIDAAQLLNNNRNKSGDLNEKLKLSWTGDLTSFKRFVEENIAISGIWVTSFKPVSVTAPVSESTCIALHKPTKQTREPITQSKRPVWLSKLPLINGPEPLILNHTDNNITRSRKSEYKVANKESPKRDETIPEFQCTEDSPEEISLIINNKPNYEADEYSLNANYDKSSITPEFKLLKLLLKIHVLLLIQI
jgi:hypothetical protein